MTTTTDTDLKELKDLILTMDKSIHLQISELNTKISDLDRKVDAKFYELDKKIDHNFYELDKKIEVSTTRTEVQFKSLEKEIQDLKKQTDKQDTRLWVAISGLFLALFGAIAKILLSSSNP